MRGYLYVLSNRAMPNLLKIGFTTRSVFDRIEELSTSGVPSPFELEFYCEVSDAPALEKHTHRKLAKCHYEKEFFSCQVGKAVEAVKLALIEENHIVFGTGGRAESTYLTDSEKLEIRRQSEENERKAEQKRRAEAARTTRIQQLEKRFSQLAPLAENAVRNHCSLGKHEVAKGIALFAIALSAPLHFGLGLALADKFSPPALDDGENTAKKLSGMERAVVSELFQVISELRTLDALFKVTHNYSASQKPADRYLVGRENETYEVSWLFEGVFHGSGLARADPSVDTDAAG